MESPTARHFVCWIGLLLAGAHGLTWERTSRRLPWQHLVVFRRSGAGD
jgi:hypothetical protein